MFRSRKLARWLGRTDPDCGEVRELSSDYLDGSLPTSILQRLRAHIANCGPCQNFVDSLASTISLLTSLPRASSTPTLKTSIMERIGRERKPRGSAG